MSVNQSVVSKLPSSISASTAESGAKSALAIWKTESVAWNQETADAVGIASSNYAIQWNAAVMPVIDEKIAKFQAVYDEKKAQYESARDQRDNAEMAVKQADEDIEGCFEQCHAGMDIGQKDSSGRYLHRKLEDPVGFSEAQNRKRKAESDVARYESQMDSFKKQMKSAESDISKAKSEKEKETKKIEEFLLGVYELNLMNESVAFLRTLKSSSIELTSNTKNKLFSRLFFIENIYRKQFEEFEKIIKSNKGTYACTGFVSSPDSLNYSAEKDLKGKKFKSKIICSLKSKESNSAKLSYTGKNDFYIPKNKLEGAQEKIQAVCKNYALSVDRNNFTVALNKTTENAAIESELGNIDSNFTAYSSECVEILDAMLAAGASSSKIRILLGKITNWHLNHWPKLWYKIVLAITTLILLAGLAFGGYMIADTIQLNKKFENSFTEWSFTTISGEKAVGLKRFELSSSHSRVLNFSIIKNETRKNFLLKDLDRNYQKNPESFVQPDEQLLAWIKENIKGVFENGSETLVSFSINEYQSDDVHKRKNEKEENKTLALKDGLYKVIIDDNGNITSFTNDTGYGFQKRK